MGIDYWYGKPVTETSTRYMRTTQEQNHKAARAVTHWAKDPDDYVWLLDMLGLTPEEARTPPVDVGRSS